MNTNPEILDLHDPAAIPQPSAPPQTRPGRTRRRRTGKVACLPKTARDLINSGLDDGVPYLKIIENLGPAGAGLTANNISEWKDGGYQDYLQDKFWRDEMRARQETFTDLLAGSDALKLPEAGLQLAATAACELLRDLSELDYSPDGKIDPNQFVRVANSLSRLSRSILTLQEYRDAAAKTETLKLKNLDKDREFVQTERTALLDAADDLFGFKNHTRLQAEAATSGQRIGSADAKSLPPLPVPEPLAPTSTLIPPSPDPATSIPSTPETHLASPADEPVTCNLQPATPAPAPPVPPIIARSAVAAPASSLGEPALVAPKSHEGGTSNRQPATPAAEPSTPDTRPPTPASPPVEPATCNLQPATVTDTVATSPVPEPATVPSAGQPATCNLQPATPCLVIEHCLACHTPLAPLLPNGRRPATACPSCGVLFPPPGTSVTPSLEHCPHCDIGLPRLLPDGQRPRNDCLKCNENLPPPGTAIEQFADHCTECGTRLPLLANGQRPDPYCECGVSLPPPRPRNQWVSEYCANCGIHLHPRTHTRHRTTETCPVCDHPLPPIPSP